MFRMVQQISDATYTIVSNTRKRVADFNPSIGSAYE